jgi:hypothetical protein
MVASHVNPHVLVLNRLWQAINVCTVDRAFALLYTGHAQVVNEEPHGFNTYSFHEWCEFSRAAQDDEMVRTIAIRIRIPRIILLCFFDRVPNKEVKYCGKKFDRRDLNLDHVVPRHQGGLTTWTNVVCSCIPCNSRKSNHTPEQARMHLIRKPKKPRWRPFMEIQFARAPHKSWNHFLDFAYWNVELGEDR